MKKVKFIGVLCMVALLLLLLAGCESKVELTPEMEDLIKEEVANLQGPQGEPGLQGEPGPAGSQGESSPARARWQYRSNRPRWYTTYIIGQSYGSEQWLSYHF